MARELAGHSISLASTDTGAVQEVHLVIIHFLCEVLEPLH